MNWKVFITACVSAFLISFPQNIIGCGPDADPYDYYTSFFHQNLPDAKAYRPFYYTGYNFLYDASEPVNTPDILAQEWAGYCAAPVTAADAKKLVNKFSVKDLQNLYYHIEKGQPLKIPDSVKQNSMTGYFLNSKDLEALGYILYARQAEPYVIGGADDWIVMPGENDFASGHSSNLVTANYLRRHGVRVYFYPGMSHVKALLVDGWVCFGSANFDALSLRLNR